MRSCRRPARSAGHLLDPFASCLIGAGTLRARGAGEQRVQEQPLGVGIAGRRAQVIVEDLDGILHAVGDDVCGGEATNEDSIAGLLLERSGSQLGGARRVTQSQVRIDEQPGRPARPRVRR